MIYSLEYPVRSITGVLFRPAVITSDDQHLIVSAADKTNRDCVMVYNAQNGSLVHKIPLKSSAIRVNIYSLSSMSHLQQTWLHQSVRGEIQQIQTISSQYYI